MMNSSVLTSQGFTCINTKCSSYCTLKMVVPLSLGPTPSGRLMNLKYIDKWSSLNLYLPVRGMSVACELGLYLCSRIGLIAL